MVKGYEKMDNNMVTGLYHCAVLELHNDALIAQFHQEPGRKKNGQTCLQKVTAGWGLP